MIDKKIKIIFAYGRLGGGGAQRQFNILIENLDKNLFEPIVFAIGQEEDDCLSHLRKYPTVKDLDDEGLKEEFPKFLSYRKLHKSCVIKFFKRKSIIKTQYQLYKAVKEIKPDIIFALTPLSAIYSSLPAFCYKRSKLIHGVRGNGILLGYKISFYNLYHLCSQFMFHYYIVNSNALRRNAQKSGFHKSKLRTIYNGVPTYYDKFKLQAKENLVTVGMIARFVPLKNHKFFLNVIKRLQTQNNFQVHLYGAGELQADLINFVKENDLEAIVKFKGWVHDVSSALQQLDVVCLTSDFEGFNNSISEAQMHGIPVVTTNCSGSDEIVESGVTGYVVNVGDLEGYSKKLSNLIDDKALRTQFAQSAFMRSRDMFSIENMVLRYQSFFKKIVN